MIRSKIIDRIPVVALVLCCLLTGYEGYWAITVLLGGIAGSVFLFSLFFKYYSVKRTMRLNQKQKRGAFTGKKYDQVNVERFSKVFFLTGLVISLASVITAFNWYSYDYEVNEFTEIIVDDDFEIEPPRTVHQPPPKSPPVVVELQLIDDDELIEDEIDIEETEATEDDEVMIFTQLETEVKEILIEDDEPAEEELQEPSIFVIVEESPQFPGGEMEMMKFIYSKIKYPPLAKENNIQGRCVASFVVNEDGSISDISLLRDIGAGCGEEVKKVIAQMPKWQPGMQRGKAVKVQYNLPVMFRLE